MLAENENVAKFAIKKGKRAYVLKEGIYKALKSFGVSTAQTVLEGCEKEGLEIVPNSGSTLQNTVDYVWDVLVELQLTQGKKKPEAFTFKSVMKEDGTVYGRADIEKNKIYIAQDVCDNPNRNLTQTVLEEICHCVTGFCDGTREFQDFAFRIGAELMWRNQ